jgi:SAM-dependent methyltransferase
MNLNELKKSWVSESNPEVQRRIWDRSADSYRARPLPTFEDNEFLQRIREQMPEMKGKRFLDVGCGAGVYALALAKEGGNALGVDISPRMIEHAKERALTDGIPNAEFDCVNWQDADIDALGYRGAFDVVFAHMTPAVCDFDTFEKLNACSRGVCLVEKPTRRSDVVLDEALSRIGIGDNGKYNSDIENTFSYLWNKGYCPAFYYHKEVWNSERTTEDMIAWCTDRARLRRNLNAEDEQTIRQFIESLALDGTVMETVFTTRVTIVWRVDEK